jgi:dihydropteroate synthase
MIWKTSRRAISIERPLVMAILNVTPDSFSDGGKFASVDAAIRHAEKCISEGADLLDVGGESTRPGSSRVPIDEEIARVVPVIEAVARRFEIPISVDTSKSEVARAAVDAGAEIINDISACRFDENMADAMAATKAGVVLMHSRGEFESMHHHPPAADIMADVAAYFRRAITTAGECGVEADRIVLDIGIGFGKTPEQNLELLAKLDRLVADFPQFPMLIGTSRKSFIGRILGDAPVDERLSGSLATAAVALWNGASILRVHDVRETLETVKTVAAIRKQI